MRLPILPGERPDAPNSGGCCCPFCPDQYLKHTSTPPDTITSTRSYTKIVLLPILLRSIAQARKHTHKFTHKHKHMHTNDTITSSDSPFYLINIASKQQTLSKAQRTQHIDYFVSFNAFSSKQKLQQALKCWSNFSLVLFGKR